MDPSLLIMLFLAASPSGQQDLSDWVMASQPALVRSALGTPAVQFRLENRSPKDVTAWGVNLRCSQPDGRIVTRSYMEESFESYEGLLPAEVRSRKVLLSQGTIAPMVLLGSTEYADVSVSVSFVVFADGTSVGDVQAIAEVFAERERIAKAWTVILAALRAGQAAGDNRKRLHVALQYLNSPNQEDFEHSAKRGMRRNLQVALDRDAAAIAADQFLREWVSRAEQTIKMVNKHRR